MKDGYKRLDLKKVSHRPHRVVSTKEALSDVMPFDFPKEVYDGTKKILVDKKGIHYVPNR